MKTIAFDARMASHPGIGRYIRSLVEAMLRRRSGHRFILVGDPKRLEHLRALGAEVRPCDLGIYGWAEQAGIAPFFEGSDLVHVPHFNVPWRRLKQKLVVTVHDLIYFRVPEYEPFPGARFFLGLWFGRLADTASGVIAVSEATRRDFEQRFGARGKTRVIHEAAAPFFAEESTNGVGLDRWGIKGRYVLFVGSIREHKNVQGLLEAFGRIEGRTDAELVLVGKLDPRFDRKHGFKAALARSPRIRWIPEASDAELKALYKGAACAVLPSFYEGFGLPALEAMACGAPVIAADAASLPEVVGGAGLLFPPRQIDRLSELLYNVLSDADLRQKLSQNGRQWARGFSWDTAAQKTLALYDEVLETP